MEGFIEGTKIWMGLENKKLRRLFFEVWELLPKEDFRDWLEGYLNCVEDHSTLPRGTKGAFWWRVRTVILPQKLARYPEWFIKEVILHELCHVYDYSIQGDAYETQSKEEAEEIVEDYIDEFAYILSENPEEFLQMREDLQHKILEEIINN